MLNFAPDMVTYAPLGVCMKGSIRYDNHARSYFVDLRWQGQRFRIYKYLGIIPCKTPEMADRLLNDIRVEVDKGIFNPDRYKAGRPLHVAGYADKWLDSIKELVSSATLHDYENSLNNHIIPAIGNEFLPDLNYEKLRSLQTAINRTPKGKYNVMGCLHKMLKDAYLSGHIKQIPPFPGFKGKEAVIPPRINWLEDEDQWKILNCIPVKHRPILLFQKVTGCRPAEARAFRWQDIKHDSIIFEVAFGRKQELKEVKGKRLRVFPRTDAVKEILDMVDKKSPTYVFINPDTNRPYDKNINRVWNRGCVEAGISISLYQATRHSFGCQLLNAGIDKALVQNLLGHSDPRMTDRYAEWSSQSKKSVLDNIIHLKGRAVSGQQGSKGSKHG